MQCQRPRRSVNRPPDALKENSEHIGRLESGISEIFSSRLQEIVYQTGEVDPNSYNPKKVPDRVHGLQRTKEFAEYLQRNYAHEYSPRVPLRALEDILEVSIHPENGGDPLLFPFLILEAKGEKGAENFEHMEIQTQFPIRDMLQLQHQLTKLRGNTRDVRGGPLVWFFCQPRRRLASLWRICT